MHTRFVFDEIIQLDVWPYVERTGSGTARYLQNITPSDEKPCQSSSVSFSKSYEYRGRIAFQGPLTIKELLDKPDYHAEDR